MNLPSPHTSPVCINLNVCSFSQIRSMGSEVAHEKPSHRMSGQRPLRSLRQTEPSVMRKTIVVPSGDGDVLAILRVDKQMGD